MTATTAAGTHQPAPSLGQGAGVGAPVFAKGPLFRTATLALLLLTLAAATARLTNLGSLSFYADEETTAFPARAIVEGRGPVMPSGMPYYRALPLTYLNAISARVFGPEMEWPYRLPSAFLGALTVPLLFFLARRGFGIQTAWVAAALLAFSEWHLVFSRQARMYVPFLLCYLLAGFMIWSWTHTGKVRHLALALVAFAAAASLHTLGLFTAAWIAGPLLMADNTRASRWLLLCVAIGAPLGALVLHNLIAAPYAETFAQIPPADVPSPGLDTMMQTSLGIASAPGVYLAAIGAAAGCWTAWRIERHAPEHLHAVTRVGRYVVALLTGGLLGLGHLHGAALAALLYLLVQSRSASQLLKSVGPGPIALAGTITLGWVLWAVLGGEPVEGLKRLGRFPFPYLVFLFQQFPTFVILAGATVLWLALGPRRVEDRELRWAAVACVALLALIGAVSRWGGTRYLFPLYPLALLLAARALLLLARSLAKPLRHGGEALVLAGAGALAVSGLISGHGVPQAVRLVTVDHGEPLNRWIHMGPFRPDHASAGRYVRHERAPADVVIAEDPLQQRWYAGSVDVWLRSYHDARQYLYTTDGAFRDIYVSSIFAGSRSMLDSLVGAATGRAWLITSGETYPARAYFLERDQRAWLDSIEHSIPPAFVARDGVTTVYCLNCASAAHEPHAGPKSPMR